MDDEESIRELGAELLDSFGYKVITASNGKEALEIYQVEKDRISMILLDLIMPEMDGKQCLAEISRSTPTPRLLSRAVIPRVDRLVAPKRPEQRHSYKNRTT